MAKKVRTKYFNKFEEFTFIPFQELPYSTNNFDNWWCKKISSIQNRPLLDVLKQIILQKKSDSADCAEATSSSNTKISSPQPTGKKRKATAGKGKFDAQVIRKFERFYNITFHPWQQEWMRQVVERRLHELEEEEQVKGLKAWSEYIEKHKPDPEPDVKDFIKPLSKNIPMIPSSKLTIAEVYHDIWRELLLKGPISERPSFTGQYTTCLTDYLAYYQ